MTYDVSKTFAHIAQKIPEILEAWVSKNAQLKGKKIPHHYNVLTLGVRLDDKYQMRIQLTRTLTQGVAFYDNESTIMKTFKRGDVIIEKTGTPKAYDMHIRYDTESGSYRPLKMDITRLTKLDEKQKAMPFINEAFTKKLSGLSPKETKESYPRILSFTLK